MQTMISSESYIILAVVAVLALVALIYLLSPKSLLDEHFVRHIDTYHLASRPNNLSSDETDFSRAAAQIENRFAFAQLRRRVTTAVIALDYFLRNDLQIFRFVIDGTTKFVRPLLCSCRVPLTDNGFFAVGFNHSNLKLIRLLYSWKAGRNAYGP
jgi:hypothetical protein